MKVVAFDRYELIGAAVAVGIVGPFAWWALDRSPPIRVAGVVAPAAPVVRGGALRPLYRGTYLRRCSGRGQRVFVDATHQVMAIDPYEFRDGIGWNGTPVALDVEQSLPAVAAPVPYGAAPGPARYQNTTHFYCNPLQKALGRSWDWFSITVRYPVVDFTVAAAAAARIDAPRTIFAPVQGGVDAARALEVEAPPPPPKPTGGPR